MMKRLHRYVTLLVFPLIILLAVTGFILSFEPAVERFSAPVAAEGLSVAQVAGMATKAIEGIEQIKRSANGQIVVDAFNQNGSQSLILNTTNGSLVSKPETSAIFIFVKELHRSLLVGTLGHVLAGLVSLALAALCLSGIKMLIKRSGGWRHLLSSPSGDLGQKWHVEIGRLAGLGLVLISVTAIYMSASSFGFISGAEQTAPVFPTDVASGAILSVADLAVLKQTDISELRALQFPFPGDPTDVYALTLKSGAGYIDQTKGEWLNFQANTASQAFYEQMYMLHTGQGAWWFGLLLGVMSLCIVALATTGITIWFRHYLTRPRIRSNSSVGNAQIVIGVGSEGNSTWGFAASLHQALSNSGMCVHTTSLNNIGQQHIDVGKMLVLTSTHGDGDAPSNASKFLANVDTLKIPKGLKVAVLGFGDSGFAQFCGYAHAAEEKFNSLSIQPIMPLTKIDKQCVQSFSRWGRDLGNSLGLQLRVEHKLEQPKTRSMVLISRTDYDQNGEEPIAVFRFAPASSKLSRFQAGDLVGVIKDSDTAARLYSLVSSSEDGFVEICVKKHTQGVCSNFLHALAVGDTVSAYFKQNQRFRVKDPELPTIMVSAGTGMAPLIGMARRNRNHNPIHFYWGGRDPAKDYLYQDELAACAQDGRIAQCKVAFSRVQQGRYVQSILIEDAVNIRSLVTQGAQILVCGGKEMAGALRADVNQILAPICVNVDELKAQGRYLEDVY